MKKLIYLFTFLLIFLSHTFAIELEGGVSFNVNSARKYVKEGQVDSIKISDHYYFEQNDSVGKVVYSNNKSGKVIAATVQYKDDPTTAYIYSNYNTLIYVEKYDKSINLYPHRGYRYNLEGKLVSTSLTVSSDELFRFTPEGKLLAHSVKGIIYDENGKKIGSASTK